MTDDLAPAVPRDTSISAELAGVEAGPLTREQRMAKRFAVPMLVASGLVIPTMILQNSNVDATWRTVAGVLDWSIWIAFLVELVVMLAVTEDRRRWLLSHPIEVIVVVLTPPFFIAAFQSVRGLRLLRLVRLLRLKPLMAYAFSLDGLKWAGLIVLLTVLAGGAAFDSIEAENGFLNGVYLAVNVATTLGFGTQPTTPAGKAIAVVLVFTGISFIALLTGAIADRFVTDRRATADARTAEIHAATQDLLVEVRALNERLARLEERDPAPPDQPIGG